MAPKPKAPVKAPQPTKHTAAPTGLQLSAAQWKAYNAAYNAYATAAYRTLALAQRRAALSAAVLNLRKSRLSAAYSMAKITAASHAVARTAAIAAFATRMSYRQSVLAHQNAALRNRVYANFEHHMALAGRAQFVYKGERVYAHTAVMRTLTTRQATTIEQALFAKAVKTAKRATASTTTAPSAATKLIQAGARAAGLAAAEALPGPQLTARQKAHNTASKHAKATASATAKATAARNRAAKKKGVKTVASAPRTAPRPDGTAAAESWQESPWCGAWRGDPDGYDCVAAAVANQLLFSQRLYHSDVQYTVLKEELGYAPSIARALGYVEDHWQFVGWPRLDGHEPVLFDAVPQAGEIIGFTTRKGPHAALYLGNGLIASWGEVLLLDDVMTGEVEEAWTLTWGAVV
jgi:hypothetical protein